MPEGDSAGTRTETPALGRAGVSQLLGAKERTGNSVLVAGRIETRDCDGFVNYVWK